jgi:hypothetical protein
MPLGFASTSGSQTSSSNGKQLAGLAFPDIQFLTFLGPISVDYGTSSHSPRTGTPFLQVAQLTATVKLTKTDEKTIRTILASCT